MPFPTVSPSDSDSLDSDSYSSACVIFTGSLYKNGKPAVLIEGKVKDFQRVLYETENNLVLSKKERLETTCATPLCLNPLHLKIKKSKEQMKAEQRTKKEKELEDFDYSSLI